MSEVRFLDSLAFEGEQAPHSATPGEASCDECQGAGGWFRYEPALAPAPGLRYLSCLRCRGSGWLALPSA